jgi:hypothetical protein
MATLWDEAKIKQRDAEHQFRNTIAQLVLERAIDGYCRICRGTVWHYESGRTRWPTMDEAKVHAARVEADNIASGDMLVEARDATKN